MEGTDNLIPTPPIRNRRKFYFNDTIMTKRGPHHGGLRAGRTATPSGVKFPGKLRMSGERSSRTPSGYKPTITKFQPSPPPVSIWTNQNPQPPLSDTHPPHGCSIVRTWLPFPPPMIPLVTARIMNYLV